MTFPERTEKEKDPVVGGERKVINGIVLIQSEHLKLKIILAFNLFNN